MAKNKFFTREGGDSEGLFGSLNFNSSKDNPENIKKNTEVVAKFFGVNENKVKRLTQKHTNKVVLVENANQETFSIEADALVTKIPHLVIGVITADCVPVLLHDSKNKVIAAVHAGWRGAFSDIIKNTINEMKKIGAIAESIQAFVGPSIKQESYEVDELFYKNFLNAKSLNSEFFTASKNQNHYMFNLPEFVRLKLQEVGVKNIITSPDDTYTNESKYFSCRRATHRKEPYFGCQMSAIMLEE